MSIVADPRGEVLYLQPGADGTDEDTTTKSHWTTNYHNTIELPGPLGSWQVKLLSMGNSHSIVNFDKGKDPNPTPDDIVDVNVNGTLSIHPIHFKWGPRQLANEEPEVVKQHLNVLLFRSGNIVTHKVPLSNPTIVPNAWPNRMYKDELERWIIDGKVANVITRDSIQRVIDSIVYQPPLPITAAPIDERCAYMHVRQIADTSSMRHLGVLNLTQLLYNCNNINHFHTFIEYWLTQWNIRYEWIVYKQYHFDPPLPSGTPIRILLNKTQYPGIQLVMYFPAHEMKSKWDWYFGIDDETMDLVGLDKFGRHMYVYHRRLSNMSLLMNLGQNCTWEKPVRPFNQLIIGSQFESRGDRKLTHLLSSNRTEFPYVNWNNNYAAKHLDTPIQMSFLEHDHLRGQVTLRRLLTTTSKRQFLRCLFGWASRLIKFIDSADEDRITIQTKKEHSDPLTLCIELAEITPLLFEMLGLRLEDQYCDFSDPTCFKMKIEAHDFQYKEVPYAYHSVTKKEILFPEPYVRNVWMQNVLGRDLVHPPAPLFLHNIFSVTSNSENTACWLALQQNGSWRNSYIMGFEIGLSFFGDNHRSFFMYNTQPFHKTRASQVEFVTDNINPAATDIRLGAQPIVNNLLLLPVRNVFNNYLEPPRVMKSTSTQMYTAREMEGFQMYPSPVPQGPKLVWMLKNNWTDSRNQLMTTLPADNNTVLVTFTSIYKVPPENKIAYRPIHTFSFPIGTPASFDSHEVLIDTFMRCGDLAVAAHPLAKSYITSWSDVIQLDFDKSLHLFRFTLKPGGFIKAFAGMEIFLPGQLAELFGFVESKGALHLSHTFDLKRIPTLEPAYMLPGDVVTTSTEPVISMLSSQLTDLHKGVYYAYVKTDLIVEETLIGQQKRNLLAVVPIRYDKHGFYHQELPFDRPRVVNVQEIRSITMDITDKDDEPLKFFSDESPVQIVLELSKRPPIHHA